MKIIGVLVFATMLTIPLSAFETVTFPSRDGLTVTADLYLAHGSGVPFIILFHQADYSRGEYREIAPRLNALGFNALAVDQRSGRSAQMVTNETATRARAQKKPQSYLDALPDMEAAVAWVRAQSFGKGRLLLWGSSYSASLVLKLAGDDPGVCAAVLAFSPGEYFTPGDLIRSSAAKIRVPVFVTSGPYEKGDWEGIFQAIPVKSKVFFLPESAGRHGSSTLWSGSSGNEAYWKAVETFLSGLRDA